MLFIVISQESKLLMNLCISIPTEWMVSKEDAIIVIYKSESVYKISICFINYITNSYHMKSIKIIFEVFIVFHVFLIFTIS